MDKPYHALKVIPNIDQELLKGVQEGRSMLSLAKEYGVSDNAIWKRVKQHPEYKTALETGIELRMDLREEQLEGAATNVDVTRADRLLGHARWLAERTAPQRFGQINKLAGADGGPIQVQIVRFGDTIEGEVVDQPIADAQSTATLPNK